MTFIAAGVLIGLLVVGRPVSLDTAMIVMTIALSADWLGYRIRKENPK